MQAKFVLIEDATAIAQPKSYAVTRAAVKAGKTSVRDVGLPSTPGEDASRPNTSATFQSTSSRSLRPVPGMSSRW